jgi:hypothetical protein
MKILEIRRHSIRSSQSERLDSTGVTLARLVGQNIGPFDRVATSTLSRALETAVAMGFAVDEQNEALIPFGREVENEVSWLTPFAGYPAILRKQGAAFKLANQLVEYYASMMNYISEGRSALVVAHGGVVELSVTGCLPAFDFSAWDEPVSYCEGARLYWDDKFIRAEELRVKL